jgi:gamma-glutamylcysteine synthetase
MFFNYANFKKQNNSEVQVTEIYIEEPVEERQVNISIENSKIHFVKDTHFFLSEGNNYIGLLPDMTEGNYFEKITNIANEIKDILDKNKQAVFIIHGYTAEAAFSTVDGLLLSKQRAERVMNLLIEQGIPKENIKYVFTGSTNLWGNNTSEEERKGNRTVTIEIE